jgi:hypothetical protein
MKLVAKGRRASGLFGSLVVYIANTWADARLCCDVQQQLIPRNLTLSRPRRRLSGRLLLLDLGISVAPCRP